MNNDKARNIILCSVLAFVVLCMAGVMFIAPKVLKAVRTGLRAAIHHKTPFSFSEQDVPKVAPASSVAVFGFASSGNVDDKALAFAFGKALADRLYCAPTHITDQPSATEISSDLTYSKEDPKKGASAALAVQTGKHLGVRYVIYGKLDRAGDNVKAEMYVKDVASNSAPTKITIPGSYGKLSEIQTQAVEAIIQIMKLKPTAAQMAELKKPNFSNPDTLITYSKSVNINDRKKALELRRKALSLDPTSLFANLRMAEFYVYTGSSELAGDASVKKFLSAVQTGYPDNSHMQTMVAQIQAKSYDNEAAIRTLKGVIDRDPDMERAHRVLFGVAVSKGDRGLAQNEAAKCVKLWPTSATNQAAMASVRSTMADDARQGVYYNSMTPDIRQRWEESSQASFRDALVATKLNPNCVEAWYIILKTGRELSEDQYVSQAFHQLTRLCPKDIQPYMDYAFCFSSQWGGSEADRARIVRYAEKAFGKGSPDVCMLKVAMLESDRGSRYDPNAMNEVAGLYKKARAACKTPREDVEFRYCRFLMRKDKAEMLKVAIAGESKWKSPYWKYWLGKAYQFRYEDAGDVGALEKAHKLFSDYVAVVPGESDGYVQLGWCLSHQGKRAEAKKMFLKALEINPQNELAREKLKYVE